jgi:hypothetical protein
MNRAISPIIFFLFVSLGLSSCFSVKNMAIAKITEENGAIPLEFGSDNSILICVITKSKSYSKYMKRHVVKEYHGKYEFVLREDLYDPKYKDTDLYRYVFDCETLYKEEMRGPSAIAFGPESTISASYYLTDRKDNKVYKCPMTSSFYGKLIKAYMIKLEMQRGKNLSMILRKADALPILRR